MACAAVLRTYGDISVTDSLMASIIIGTIIETRMLERTRNALARISWLGSYKHTAVHSIHIICWTDLQLQTHFSHHVVYRSLSYLHQCLPYITDAMYRATIDNSLNCTCLQLNMTVCPSDSFCTWDSFTTNPIHFCSIESVWAVNTCSHVKEK